MGLIDFLFGNKKKEEQERLEREKQAEAERLAAERARLAAQKAEEERKKKAEQNAVKPFVFKSNQHQRYENGLPTNGLQNCIRTVSLELNTNGCPGYKLNPGDGYIVKIFNDDLGKPQMADKPMRLYRKSDTSVEFRGYEVLAMTPFGYDKIDQSDYSFIVYYENGIVSKCVLHMLDRNIFLEYRKISTEEISKPQASSDVCEAEQYALLAREAAKKGDTSLAHRTAIKALESFISNPGQSSMIKDTQSFALALGKMMEGDNFSDNDTISKAVAISYYYLTKAIKECSNKDPYLFVYRFSISYEYNKAFYHLFAHSEGRQYSFSPFDFMSQSATMAYEHHLKGMQMCDMFTEPRIGQLDNALNNIFHQIVSEFSNVDPTDVKRIGNKYHDQLYSYMKTKIENNDLSF